MLVIYNVHNFKLSTEQVRKTVGSLKAELSVADSFPERATIMVMGGFNLVAAHTSPSDDCACCNCPPVPDTVAPAS